MPFALCVKTVVSYNISLDLNKFLAILYLSALNYFSYVQRNFNERSTVAAGYFFLLFARDFFGGMYNGFS
jgi:hypothetical protein